MHQNPNINDDFLRDDSKTTAQDLEKTLVLTRPVNLDTVPSSFKIKSFVGVYSENELQNYLDCLKKNLGNYSFSLILHCDQHAIFVSYNSETQQWLYINPNDMPGVEYLHSDLLARAILYCYDHANGLSMATDVYAELKHYHAINDAFLDMTQQLEWSTLHNVSKEKIKQADAYQKQDDINSVSLLELAIAQKDLDWIQQALRYVYIDDGYVFRLLGDAEPAVINFVFEKFKPGSWAIENSLRSAIVQNQLESASILIKKIKYPSADLLNLAFLKKRTEILNMMLDNTDAIILDSVCSNSRYLSLLTFLLERFTPDQRTLCLACESRNIEAVKLILTHFGHPKLSNEQCRNLFNYKFNATQQESVCDLFLVYVPIDYQKDIFSLIQPDFQTELAKKINVKSNEDNVTQEYKDELDKLKEEARGDTSQELSSRFK